MHMSQLTIAYGMTETSPVSFQSATRDSLERRVATVGRVHPHLMVKIVDGDGRVLPRGVQGELLTRGYSVMKGYWDDPERTAEVIDESGWMHTGDLATLDEEGYCTITGRLKDMLIRGGENVYPREIEEFLYRHPKVQAVQVFGVPDPKYGEEVCAWVVPAPRPECDCGGTPGVLLRPDRASQDSAPRAVRGGIPHDRDRQGTEVHHAGGDVLAPLAREPGLSRRRPCGTAISPATPGRAGCPRAAIGLESTPAPRRPGPSAYLTNFHPHRTIRGSFAGPEDPVQLELSSCMP